jgi:predicted glycoside hydrolase/deacetylase ChbG (UPF0249 family)
MWRLKRYLIVNADDFGQSHGVNRGIIEAHECGVVTSASLMVRWPAARKAAAYARRHPKLSVGLHFDFAEWTCENGNWRPLYEVVSQDDVRAVRQEARRQLTVFRKLLDRDPTHLDSHQHAHRQRTLLPIFKDLAGELSVPLRSVDPRVRYIGSFYGQSTPGRARLELISAGRLLKIIKALKPGFTELGCHPGHASDLRSMYKEERRTEIDSLCNSRVSAAISEMGVQLSSFHDFKNSPGGQSVAMA